MADEWSFLTKHASVLLCIAEDPGARLRDIAATVGTTERVLGSAVMVGAGLRTGAPGRPRGVSVAVDVGWDVAVRTASAPLICPVRVGTG